MEPVNPNTVLEQLVDQLESVGLLLARPVVQRQLLAIVFILFAAWLLSRFLGRLQRRLERRAHLAQRFSRRLTTLRRRLRLAEPSRPVQRRANRSLRLLERTYFPLLILLLGWLTTTLFRALSWQSGLIVLGLPLIWLLLFYWLGATLLYAVLAQSDARSYDRTVLKPVLLALAVMELGRELVILFSLSDVELLQLLGTTITLSAIAKALVILYLFWASTRVVQHFLRAVILPRTGADTGAANTILTVTGYAITGVGVLVALRTLGMDLSTLAIVAGGISLGIGFGLQKLVANFFSGILLLFEQSIRPGDVIEVNGQVGVVEKLRIRATTVRTYDNVEIVVPNENLLTTAVTTHTHSDRLERVRLPVGVSYRSEPKQVREALLAVARRHGLVLEEPAPVVFFLGFGESSLNFELAIWVGEPIRIPVVRSDLYFMIWEELKDCGIEIPFPQRDLHVRSGLPWLDSQPPESTS